MRQLTKEEAIRFADSGSWERMSFYERAYFQMKQDLLCMPFGVFHEAIEKALDRSVFTHEFGLNRDGLIAELEGKQEAPSFEDILNLIPKEKLVLVVDNSKEPENEY